ncbi:DUF6463 family protein [Kocuria tytonis]|uniref:DUF6463 family protein n=1 Tax=Kocuria tytonis TaxID=2054280 RepID=UPI0011C436A3|nr:DUF6463 family protein [Kocuria tytonis]
MTYNVSRTRWIGIVVATMGATHLALADWAELVKMRQRGWWGAANDNAASGQALWFAAAGGALVAMGSFATGASRSGERMPRIAATAFTATMMAAFTATRSVGAGLGTVVGIAMCRDAFRLQTR